MSGRAVKATRRAIRKAFGQPATELLGAHEAGLTDHGDILAATVMGPLWARLLWLIAGARAVFWVRSKLSRGAADGEA